MLKSWVGARKPDNLNELYKKFPEKIGQISS